MHLPTLPNSWLLLPLLLLSRVPPTQAGCIVHTPAFPIPELNRDSKIIQQAKHEIITTIEKAISSSRYNTTTLSLAITSSTETLFDFHHTARDRDTTRPGAETTTGDTCYRIASCTKAFTVLALLQQQKAGTLNLDDPITKYIRELNGPNTGVLPWKDITLRTLASQLSGIPRDIGQSDYVTLLDDPTAHGLPPLRPSDHHEVQCDSIVNYTSPCTRKDLLSRLFDTTSSRPIFPPKQQSTYSNLNYELLSLALETATSTPFEKLIQNSILTPLNLTSTSFNRPADSVAALPKNISSYWDVEMGIQNPTGGLYSSSNDLSKFLRYILTHYNGLTPALNWISPVSFSNGLNTFYGMPWEIFRTTRVLPSSKRPVTFVTKGGGLPGYLSMIALVPDYGFAFTLLVAGDGGLVRPVLESVAVAMVKAADRVAHDTLREKYTGRWVAGGGSLNSSFEVGHSVERGGLYVASWISNGTDMLAQLGQVYFPYVEIGGSQYLQAVPTLLFVDERRRDGEVWRLIAHHVDLEDEYHGAGRTVFDDEFCFTDIDTGSYGGLPVNEIVFWDKLDDGTFGSVELTGFRLRLDREKSKHGEASVRTEGEKLIVQE